ncbi:hypothetical protein A4H02_05905 [Fervidobacterium thailandense]|uniref:Uncharacterized protein n=1 Tax=Fervidobacterium thailandense TaxID=1008305 RepID=A0A1E3G3F7_9BACT|nr:hypothetical protein A4H02_05905 [Fervidobacterium thailandense]
MMGVIENTHRADDEYFLMIHAERCKRKEEFLDKAQRWQDTWNKARSSNGKGMKGKQNNGVRTCVRISYVTT